MQRKRQITRSCKTLWPCKCSGIVSATSFVNRNFGTRQIAWYSANSSCNPFFVNSALGVCGIGRVQPFKVEANQNLFVHECHRTLMVFLFMISILLCNCAVVGAHTRIHTLISVIFTSCCNVLSSCKFMQLNALLRKHN